MQTPCPGRPIRPVARRKVDARQDVLDALAVVLDAAGVQEHRGLRGAPELGGLLDAGRGHAGDVGAPSGRVVAHGLGRRLEAVGVRLDEVVVEPVALDQEMQDRAHQGRVGAGTQPEEHVGGAGEWGDARVGDDELAATVTRPPHVARSDRCALGDVRAGHEHDVGERDVGPGVRRAVDAERALVRRAGRHHAQATVVVEVRGAHREAGELADEVCLLRRERDARRRSRPSRVRTRPGCGGSPTRSDRAPRPTTPAETRRRVRASGSAAGRDGSPCRYRFTPFGQSLPSLNGNSYQGSKPTTSFVADLEDDPALLATEAAVRLHLAVDLEIGVPPARAAPR